MELTAAEAWSRILERARTLLPEQTYRTWLARTEPVALTHDRLAIATGNEFAAEWIEDKYGDLLAEIAERLFGHRLEITVEHRPPAGTPVLAQDDGHGAAAAVPRTDPAPSDPPGDAVGPAGAGTPVAIGSPLNERYTFDRFVVGTNNQLSAAACRAVAEAPARTYNPLFIYGGR